MIIAINIDIDGSHQLWAYDKNENVPIFCSTNWDAYMMFSSQTDKV